MADYRTYSNLPRGIRNNNPGNFKADGSGWKGNVGNDGVFYIFADTTWGLRALALDLTNKMGRGLVTIRQIISEYAPPSENDTASYISAVAADSGIGPDDLLSQDQVTVHDLMRAIVNHENGETASYQYVSDADIDQGIQMMNSNILSTIEEAGTAVEENTGGAQTILYLAGAAVVLWLVSRN